MPASGKLLLSDMVANVRKFMGENAPSDDCAVYTRVASAMGRFGEGFSAPDFAKVIGPHGFPENSILLGSTNKGPVFLLASPKTFQEKVYGRKSSPSVALFAGSNARWVPLSTPRTKIGTPSVGFTWGNVMRVAGQIAIFGSLDSTFQQKTWQASRSTCCGDR